jgi:hypothetical protein|tara:strand:- start:360 stop:548 length:189 start_codon:yes stop_codon:yes gene_type:complete
MDYNNIPDIRWETSHTLGENVDTVIEFTEEIKRELNIAEELELCTLAIKILNNLKIKKKDGN